MNCKMIMKYHIGVSIFKRPAYHSKNARECTLHICTCIWLHMIELAVTNADWWIIAT